MATVIIKMRLRAHTHTNENTRTNLFIIYISILAQWAYTLFGRHEEKKVIIRTMSNMPLNAFRRRANDVTIIQRNK